jgi:type I restriction enzyme S subunit
MKQGWEIKKLGEVVDIINGRNQSQVISENGEYPIYGSAGNLMGYATDYLCEKGTTIIGRKGNISNPIFIEERFWNVDTAFGLFPKNGYDPKFINYLCQTIDFKSRNRGTTIPSLVKSDLLTIVVPFISHLPEQQRIVSILNECFAAIDKAKTNAEQNLKNAKELFESYLQGVFENGNWETKEFGEIITTLTDYHANGSYQILKKNVELKETEDYAWMVRSTDFENNFENEFRFIDESSYNFLSKSKVFGGEIIMSKIGNAGNVYLMPKIDRPCSLAMNLFLIRLNEKKAVPEFIFQFLKSSNGEFQIKSRLQGATTKTITKDNVRNIIVPLPKLDEQQTIVHQLDALRAETQKLEAVYQKKKADLEELKKSILQKAFAGELRNPEGVRYDSQVATPRAGNDGYSPSEKKLKNKVSPDRA